MSEIANYSHLAEVKGFIKFLSERINIDDNFRHSYTINNNGHNNAGWINFNNGQVEWNCNNLFGAYKRYYWGTKDFSETSTELNQYSLTIKNAYRNNDETTFLKVCWDILKWGGVKNYNSGWLLEKYTSDCLISSFRDSYVKLREYEYGRTRGQGAIVIADWKTDGSPYRMNAGYTKIYSLLFPNFIIYDSRVAAALGLLVTKYCESSNLNSVPARLRFPWMEAKEGENVSEDDRKIRDPSRGDYTFTKITNNAEHAKWNVHANHIIQAAIRRRPNDDWFSCEENGHQDINLVPMRLKLRAFESALFMIGYDLDV